MRRVVGYLSEQDLDAMRRHTANERIADSGNPSVSQEQASRLLIASWEFGRELRERYELDPEESYIYTLDVGAIVEVPD